MSVRIGPGAPATGGGVSPAGDEARLREAARQMEGVFVQEMFKAMRETVPQDGILSASAGEDMFRSMFDEHVAMQLPAQLDDERGLSAALYRQLRERLDGA